MSRIVRVGVAGALAASAALGLAACSPKASSVAALRFVDGEFTLLIASCDGFEANRISVYPETRNVAGNWTVARGTGEAPHEVPLTETPQGWTVEVDTLGELRPDTEYGVSVFSEGAKSAVPIRFTVEQVAKLKGDDVLVGQPADVGKAVSEKEFRSDACE